MAEGTSGADVNEMFQKMGEKLGWFKGKNSDKTKQSLKLSAKKTKMKKENTELESGGSKTNGKKSDKLKLKKKVKATQETSAKQKEKSEFQGKPNCPSAKAQSFRVLLSSDSDSSLTDIPKHNNQKANVKAILQVCSDSDDDFAPNVNAKAYTNEVYVKESFEETVEGRNLPNNIAGSKFEPILDIKPIRKSSIDCNDTVVKNRVSLASCTLDLDSLGEPLVESTRIHRRSSITYKQIMGSFNSSAEDCFGEENVENNERKPVKRVDEITDLSTSICNETNYITAIESVDDTVNSSDFNSSNRTPSRCQTNEIHKQNDKVGLEKKHEKYKEHILSEVSPHQPNKSESEEEIEVMDTATQTDEQVIDNSNGLKLSNEEEKNVHQAYKEETIVDGKGKVFDFANKYRTVDDVYNEDTVQDGYAGVGSHSLNHETDILEVFNTEKDKPDISGGDDRMVNDIEDKLASTTIGTQIHNYSEETVDNESKAGSKIDVFNEITGLENKVDVYDEKTDIIDSDHSHNEEDVPVVEVHKDNSDANDSKYKHEDVTDNEGNSFENENNVSSGESLYEVNDAETQTVESHEDVINHANEEELESDQDENELKNSEDDFNKHEESDEDENVNQIKTELKGKSKLEEDITDESDTSERSKDSTNDSDDSSDAVSTSFAEVAKKSGNRRQKDRPKKVEVTDQSWRSSRRYSSDSSSDGDLEAFFQKMKKPVQVESDSSSPVSMDEFIVEDDEITDESDDSGFYLRETQELENRKGHLEGLQVATALEEDDDGDDVNGDDDGSDESDDFSSKIYPPSVTKHKKKKQAKGMNKENMSWTFSSDTEEETEAKNSNSPLKMPKEDNKSKDTKVQKNSKKNVKSKIDIDLSSDSEDDVGSLRMLPGVSKIEIMGKDKPMKNTTQSLSEIGMNDIETASVPDEEPLFKTPKPLKKKKTINDNDKENVFKTPTSTKSKVPKTPTSMSKPLYISLSDTDSDVAEESSDFVVSASDSSATSKTSGTPFTPLSLKNVTSQKTTPLSSKSGISHVPVKPFPTCTFLKSLSNTTDESRRHPEARRFAKNFKKNKEELSSYLFKLYNKTIFENKLPSDLPVIWNKRLLRTAGYCAYKKNSKDDRDRSTRIELSVKVCDNAERVRDTLIHELCHAAVWLLNGVNGGHGSYWKYWARHATRVHPELPAISVCHSYSINTKFTYRCKKCGYSIGRHSKSLDVKKKVCGYCRGEFELIQNSVPTTPTSAAASASSAQSTPRLPNKFALFVKDNYNSVKKQNQGLKHGEVMKELSKLFAESKITS